MNRSRPLPRIIAGSAHPALASALAASLGEPLAKCTTLRFPDGEMNVDLGEDVRGRDVVIVQPTAPPVGERVLELLLFADALHRNGVATVSAVVPYFGFARQERRSRAGEALGAHVVADLIDRGRFARVFAVDLHAPAIEGFLSTPLDNVSAVPLLSDAVRRELGDDREAVIVSPDIGGTKLARGYATRLGLPLAVVLKSRSSGRDVAAMDLFGDVAKRRPIIVDDLISTGGTIVAAAEMLREHGARGAPLVVATHAVLAGDAAERLERAGVGRLITTNTLPETSTGAALDRRTVDVAPLLAESLRARMPT